MDKRVNYIYLYHLQVKFYSNRHKGLEGYAS